MYATIKAAAVAHVIAVDGNEWTNAMEAASAIYTGRRVRELFCLLNCHKF